MIKKFLIPCFCAFMFMQAMGFFCAWIGGVKPFTADAAVASMISIAFGFVLSFLVVSLIIHYGESK